MSKSIKTQTDIIEPVIAWIKSIHPEIKVIQDRSNRERPDRPYISIRMVTAPQKLGSNDSLIPAADDKWCLAGQRSFVITIVAYSKGDPCTKYEPQDLLRCLEDSVDEPGALSDLVDAGLAVWQSDDILDTTELLETGFEPRAQLDVTMGIVSNRIVDLGVIESVEITPTINGQEDTKQIISE